MLILRGEPLNGIAHFIDDLIAARDDLDAESDFFEHLAIASDGGNAQIGATEINANGEVGHGRKL